MDRRTFLQAAAGTVVVGFGGTGAPAASVYPPELSTDFLELPWSLNGGNYYRFFDNDEPLGVRTIDLVSTLPRRRERMTS